jgi:hypothetical protein
MPATSSVSTGTKAAAASVQAEASSVRGTPALQRFARLGLCSRSVIYVLLAYMAADIALTDTSPAQPSGTGALTEIGHQPGGRALLALLAIGLAGYAAWRSTQALGQDDQESAARRAVQRVGWALVAAIYAFLCVRAIATAVGAGGGGGGTSSNPQPVVGLVLRWPGGPLWVGLAGAAMAIGGVALTIWGTAHDYSDVLSVPVTRPAFRAAQATGVIGEATRGILIVLVSVYLLDAAITDDPSHAKTLGEALRAFDRFAVGPAVLLAAAAGLACFAGYSVFEALYRRL